MVFWKVTSMSPLLKFGHAFKLTYNQKNVREIMLFLLGIRLEKQHVVSALFTATLGFGALGLSSLVTLLPYRGGKKTVPDSLPATPKSPPTRRVTPRGTPRVPASLPLSPFSPPHRDRRGDSPAWSGRDSRPSRRFSGWGRPHEEIRDEPRGWCHMPIDLDFPVHSWEEHVARTPLRGYVHTKRSKK